MNLKKISTETRKRYLITMSMFVLLIGVAISSAYFLYVPGGYQGGRNPRYNMRIIFERDTWGDIHIWTSMMLSVILWLHIFLHTKWIRTVFIQYLQLWKQSVREGKLLRIINVLDDGLSAVFFIICLFSGLVLLIVPGGRGTATIVILWVTRENWKLIHIWSGVGMLAGVFLHLVIHWKWMMKVSRKVVPFKTNRYQGGAERAREKA
jgi:hypothetical protein